MTASPSRCYGGHKAAEDEGDPGTSEKGIQGKKCGQRASDTAAGRWRRQLHKTKLDGVEQSVSCMCSIASDKA